MGAHLKRIKSRGTGRCLRHRIDAGAQQPSLYGGHVVRGTGRCLRYRIHAGAKKPSLYKEYVVHGTGCYSRHRTDAGAYCALAMHPEGFGAKGAGSVTAVGAPSSCAPLRCSLVKHFPIA